MENGAASSEIPYWLALQRIPGIGSKTFQSLLKNVGPPREVFAQSDSSLRALGLNDAIRRHIKIPDWKSVDIDLSWLDNKNNHLITLSQPSYPPLLKEIPDLPPILFVTGNPEILSATQIAIVGSRNPTPMGKKHAHDFAYSLASTGLTITSGLALGIDSAGHCGAIDCNGLTIAVAGNGLDRVYPARNKALAEKISETGALVSEFPPGTAPTGSNFPRRNRIISGLSSGVLVVEAALQSGSLITAKLSMEQGREVFAIPGSIQNPLSKGCHALLRDGAKLVETVQDIVEEINHIVVEATPPATDQSCENLEKDYEMLLKYIAYDPTPVDTLVQQTGESPESIASMLLVLELKGHISSAAGGCYYRVR